MAGKTGQFTLCELQSPSNSDVWALRWARTTDSSLPPGMVRTFQIQTEGLYDMALLAREMVDVIEQAIAVEIQRGQAEGWTPPEA